MKFGEQLRTSIIKEYEYYYIAYDELKDLLKTEYKEPPQKGKPKPERKEWAEANERQFIDCLEQELDKVYTKQKVKLIEIGRRIASSQKEVAEVVARLNSRAPPGSRQNDEDIPTEEDFMMLEEDISDILADVHDLAKFVQLNYTGFQKIIKKHDKQNPRWMLKPVFAARLKAKPFFKVNYDQDIIKLSKLSNIVKNRGHETQGDSAAGGSQSSFVRNTTKYWVHPDHITEVKLLISKHLPVLVFSKDKEYTEESTAISSIYYDNPETWELYEGRLKKSEGAEAIRLRWYGGMKQEDIYVERKTHREDWTGEESVKARFTLKEKLVNGYMKGEILPRNIFAKARDQLAEGQSSKKIDEDERMAREVQYSVIKKGFVPVCRSFYHRVAFQLPGDARVRISLDTDLAMTREDNLDGRKRAGSNWRRMDIGVDYPFSQLPAEDIERFPYAILEVKLQTASGQTPPDWIRELIASHLVEAVPKFSKFIHGTATLFPHHIDLIPFWLPQMNVDIRKPAIRAFGIRRPGQSKTTSSDDDDDLDSDEDENEFGEVSQATTVAGDSEELTERLRGARDILADRDLEGRATGNALDVEEQVASQPLNEDYPLYDSDDEDAGNNSLEEARRIGGWTFYSAVVKKHVNLAGQHIVSRLTPSKPSGSAPKPDQTWSKRFKAPKGKKIHVPVRVEPKVYFAAERTFLSWLEFSIYIGTIAATLLNFGDKPTRISFIAAGTFSVIAVCSLLYSIFLYLKRSKAIRERKAITYHDNVGPPVLCFTLFVGILLNALFEVSSRGYIDWIKV